MGYSLPLVDMYAPSCETDRPAMLAGTTRSHSSDEGAGCGGVAGLTSMAGVVLDMRTQNRDEPVGEITFPGAKLPF